MLKKAAILSSSSGLHFSIHPCHPSTTSPSSLPPPRDRPSHNIQRQLRTYADVKSYSSDIPWPEQTSTSHPPTPYQIFRLEHGEPYSKRTFYELVKLYHPDRNGHTDTHCGGLSQVVKLERYRLVILAHEILSDPVKRKEYDRCGAGWMEKHERWSRHSKGHYSASGKPFGTGAGFDASPFRNATWEDWESWYARDHRTSSRTSSQAYEGNYISPNGFASLIILLAVISGVASATRSGQYSMTLEDKIRSMNHETNSFMSSRVESGSELGHDGRVKLFLEKRDPSKFGLKDEEELAYQKTFSENLLPAPKSSAEPGQ